MSGLIYRRILSQQWTTAGEQAERAAFLAKLDEALKKAGGMRLVILQCDAADALAQWETLGTEIFPNSEAVQAYQAELEALGLTQAIQTEAETGTSLDFERWLTACKHEA